MSATEELKQEHRIIERMLAVLEAAAARVDAGRELPADFFPRAVDFIRNFADRCHHGKEEDNLFPTLEKLGIPGESGPIGVMLAEHEQGRALVRGMEEDGRRYAKGEKKALNAAAKNARDYAQLLRQHIDKEDNILYEMADRMLSPANQMALIDKFEEVELERIGAGKHKEYLKLVEDLEREMGLGQAGSG
ncbi:MAG: hemerythrin domain-containing protein [Chloroflexota bacterium]